MWKLKFYIEGFDNGESKINDKISVTKIKDCKSIPEYILKYMDMIKNNKDYSPDMLWDVRVSIKGNKLFNDFGIYGSNDLDSVIEFINDFLRHFGESGNK